jgi:hypothetical protein
MASFFIASLLGICAAATVQAAEPPAEAQIYQLARAYYDTAGEWAGKFTIVRIMKTRLELVSETRVIAHIQYQAAFIQAPEHTSIDQRTFDLVYLDDQWQVTRMGAHQSGRP